MWFSTLTKEDQNLIANAFTSDGFRVQKSTTALVAEKHGQKIIITRLDSARLVLNLKRYLFQRKLLATSVGGVEFSALFNFLQREKGVNESYLECLKRVAIKFNWEAIRFGQMEVNSDLASVLASPLEYVEIETDRGDLVTIMSFKDEYESEKVYAANGAFFKVFRQLEQFDKKEAIRDLAPNAYLALQAFSF